MNFAGHVFVHRAGAAVDRLAGSTADRFAGLVDRAAGIAWIDARIIRQETEEGAEAADDDAGTLFAAAAREISRVSLTRSEKYPCFESVKLQGSALRSTMIAVGVTPPLTSAAPQSTVTVAPAGSLRIEIFSRGPLIALAQDTSSTSKTARIRR